MYVTRHSTSSIFLGSEMIIGKLLIFLEEQVVVRCNGTPGLIITDNLLMTKLLESVHFLYSGI